MKLPSSINRFARDRSGMATLELMVLMPILFAMIFGSYSLFDFFFNYNKSIKATQTVSDIISRQTEIDNAYIDRLHNVYRTISQAQADEPSWMRVTTVVNTATDPTAQSIEVDWSYVAGDESSTYSTGDSAVLDFVPTLLPGQSVVIVETSRDAKPIFTWDPFVPGGSREFPNSFTFPLRFSTDLSNLDFPDSGSLASNRSGGSGS